MEKIKPMLAHGEAKAVNDPGTLWEPKYDGARILAFVNGNYNLQARSGTDKTGTFPELQLQTKLPCILDGEIVSATGKPFQDAIQKRINRQREISIAVIQYPAKLMVFDVLEIGGKNVEALPLMSRKELLSQVLIPTKNVDLAPYYDDGVALFANAVANGEEGIVGKAKQGQYARDKRDWIKVKCFCRNYGLDSTKETILAVGWTKGTGWREGTFGALVLGRMEADGTLTYVGEVGTGFNNHEIDGLVAMFSPVSLCPFPREPEPATWIKPFAIKVRYLEYTNEGLMRFPSYKGVV